MFLSLCGVVALRSPKHSYLSSCVSQSVQHGDVRSEFNFLLKVVKNHKYCINIRLPIPGFLFFSGLSDGFLSWSGYSNFTVLAIGRLGL